MAEVVSISKSPDFSFFTNLGLPPIPLRAFSTATGDIFPSSPFGTVNNRNRAYSEIVSVSVGFRDPMQKGKRFGSRRHRPPWSPTREGNYRLWETPASASTLMLAGTYTLRATSGNVDHP
ncbi:hypothetical protein AVEN_61392-1 [Araneus ventricosus]|uniref:Uncharacterized protein n=1 Tax=Araneus ventricosus TaxID=182803 RepID=A0A4Y2QDA3_ARAVE|nr:hypothetical protein AVEN_61392-1 [Araneus ventricosus]